MTGIAAPIANAHGIALVKVMLFTAILLGLATFGAQSSRVETRIANNDLQMKQALTVAEAGIHEAYQRILADPTVGYDNELAGGGPTGGTGGGLAGLGSFQTRTENGVDVSYRFRQFGSVSSDGYFVRVDDNFDEAAVFSNSGVDSDSRIWILSRGIVGSPAGPAERILRVGLRQVPIFGDGLHGDEFVRIRGGSEVDSYNSEDGPCCPSPRGENGGVSTNGNLTVDGSPTYVYGDAEAGGTVYLNGAGEENITQGHTSGAPPVYFPPVVPPPGCGVGSCFVQGLVTGGICDPSTGDLHKDGGLLPITLRSGTYCFGSITLNGQAELRVDIVDINGDGTLDPVIVYLVGEGTTNLTGGGVVNPDPSIPSHFQIYGAATSGGINVRGGSDAAMTIYAPDIPVAITGGSDFFGAIVGNSIDVGGGVQVHYDESLSDFGAFGGQLADWHEIRY